MAELQQVVIMSEAVVAAFEKLDGDIISRYALGNLQGFAPVKRGVPHALQKVERAAKLNAAVEKPEMVCAIKHLLSKNISEVMIGEIQASGLG